MIRIWLALLLSLSLWPAPALAGQGVPGSGEPDRIEARGGEYAEQVVRSTSGVELVRSVAERVPTGATRALPDTLPLRAGAIPAVRAPAPRGADTDTRVHSSSRLCERLPYYATAPPARR